jgi:uncharacterized RDD family membrane protein YckC
MAENSSHEQRGVGIRFVAQVVDLVLLFAVGYVIAAATGSTTGSGFELEGGPAFLWFGISAAYFVALEGAYGQTVGKRLTGIVVLTETGDPIDVRDSLVRNVLRVVDGFVLYAIGVVLILLSDRNQRFGDRVADTVVVPAGEPAPAADDTADAVADDTADAAADDARPG